MSNSNKILVPTNKHQTPIDEKLKASLEPEVYTNVLDFIESVEFVKKLVAPDRPYIEDMPKDENGLVIPDVTNPHILTDMDYFIQDRIHFEKYGYYTAARFSHDPRSEYRKYWDEQRRRSLEGYVNEATGEWISGYNYFYWNFGRIFLSIEHAENVEKTKGRAKHLKKKRSAQRIRADRVERFPDIWEADYFFYHYIEAGEEAGEYGAYLKSRGVGASFKAANMFNRNFFLIKGSKSYAFAYNDGYLYEDGLLNTKTWDAEAFIQSNTAFTKRKTISKPGHRQSGFIDKNTGSTMGYRSEIIGVNTKNPNFARGKRGKIVVHEEGGSHRYLTKSWNITDRSLNDKGYVFGYQLAMGTGGDDQSDFIGLARLFFSPKAFNVHAIRNVFDKNSSGSACGFFTGDYMNRPGSYNSDGVSDIVKNLVDIFIERAQLEKELDDPSVIEQKKAEGAITPLEAIVTMEKSVFPKAEAKALAIEMASNAQEVFKKVKVGWVRRTGSSAQYIPAPDRFALREYPYNGTKAHKAGVQIFEPPITQPDGTIPSFRYIAGIDTIEDDDSIAGSSLFSIKIMDLWKDVIVASYAGRSIIADDDYEVALAMLVMYNATANYENNLKGMYGYCKNRNALRFLADTPQIVFDKGFMKGCGQGNKSKGTRAGGGINAWGRQLQATWMRKPHSYYENMTGLETIQDLGYLREISLWNSMDNFDRVSDGNMLFIYREELVRLTDTNKFSTFATTADYETDEFFQDIYNAADSEMGQTTPGELDF